MSDLKRVLMERDGLTSDEADEVAEFLAALEAGEDPEDVLYGVGLEPDYAFDLLP
jgi:hypothetical protein